MRELIALVEDTGQGWAASLIRLLVSMKDAVAQARAAGLTELPLRQRAGYEAAYTRLIQLGERANPPPPPTGRRGRPKQTPARNLLDRLITHRAAVLASRSVYDFNVPFDNGYAAYCTSIERFETTSGKRRRSASFFPRCLVGASVAGGS